MFNSRERSKVPLPDVPNFSDDIELGELSLPIGFDDERLLVNLNAIDRIRKITGLDHLAISRSSEYQEPITFNTTSLDSNGSATGTAAKSDIEQKPRTILDYPSGTPMVGSANAQIKINDRTVRKVIDSSKLPRKEFNPLVLSKALNTGLKEGLQYANKEANISERLLHDSLVRYGGWSLIAQLMNTSALLPAIGAASPSTVATGTVAAEVVVAAVVPAMHYAELAFSAVVARMIDKESNLELLFGRNYKEKEIDTILKNPAAVRKSLFYGASFDKYVAGNGNIRTSKIIRARS